MSQLKHSKTCSHTVTAFRDVTRAHGMLRTAAPGSGAREHRYCHSRTVITEDHTSASASLHFKICHNAIYSWVGTAKQWVISARKPNGTLRTSPSPTLEYLCSYKEGSWLEQLWDAWTELVSKALTNDGSCSIPVLWEEEEIGNPCARDQKNYLCRACDSWGRAQKLVFRKLLTQVFKYYVMLTRLVFSGLYIRSDLTIHEAFFKIDVLP